MQVIGRVQDGVVLLDTPDVFPEGAVVTVTLRTAPVIRVAKTQRRVEFPLIRSAAPGSVQMTNQRIAEILDEEDVEALKRSWDVPS
jgi:hypothetical protein